MDTIDAAPEAAPGPPALGTGTNAAGASAGTSLNAADAATVAAWIKEDLASGKLTPERAEAVFNELQTAQTDRQPDARSPEVRLLDEHFPAEKDGSRYSMPFQHDPGTPEMEAFIESSRTWLHQADFPRGLGNSMITTVNDIARHTERMTPEQLQRYGEAEYVTLGKIYGDALDGKLKAAGRMIQALEEKTPGLNRLLQSHGIGDSARIVVQLIDAAERYWARRKT